MLGKNDTSCSNMFTGVWWSILVMIQFCNENGENLKRNKYYWHDLLSTTKLFDLKCLQGVNLHRDINV